jgi:Bifunctional DNA primase/polymerase, N-terminal/Primase C terminal 1 (PriCT-1)
VIDVDPRHGGNDSLAELERRHGPLPDTPRVLTGGGGVHLYFAVEQLIGNRVGLAPGIDLRGDGGFVVAPPSLHASGRHYLWELGASPDDVPVALAPGSLLERVREGRPTGPSRPPDEWARLLRDPIAAGSGNDNLARLAGYLLRCLPAPRVVLELVRVVNEARCMPPLSDEEITRTVDSIARREAKRTRHADPGA